MKKKKRNILKRFAATGMLMTTLSGIGTSLIASPIVHADDVSVTQGMTQDEFINAIGPKAQKIASEKGIYASVMIAQAILESGWGQSTLSKAPNYNLFGIKGSYEGNTVNMNTTEYSGENSYSTNAGFRQYPSFDASLQDNADLIATNLYSGAWKVNTETYKDATAALTGLYATNETYGSQLNSLIELYNLTKYDVAPDGVAETATKHEVKPDFETRTVEEVKDITYSTKENDSLWGISQEYKVSVDQIKNWNKDVKNLSSEQLSENTKLKVGEDKTSHEEAYQVITETNDIIHNVVAGDSVWKIATSANLSLGEIHEINPQLPADNIIYPNDKIKTGEETKTYDKILTEDEKAALIKEAEDKAKALDEADRVTTSAEANVTTVSTTDTSNASESAKKVIALAEQQIGKPYVWGARGPDSFDCSGLMQYVFRNALGMEIGSWTVPQESAGTIISIEDAQPGDLYFWGSQGATTHVALATGNGSYIHAPQPGDNVKVGNTQWYTPSFAVRVIK